MKTLHHIRHEKYEVVDYLGEVLKSFKDFVQRPDPKQEYVSQWQIDFNRLGVSENRSRAVTVLSGHRTLRPKYS